MEFVCHRINSIQLLKTIPNHFGIEIDLRDHGADIVLSHDPFQKGDNFEDYLKKYHHGTLILNIKSERIEWTVLELLKRYSIQDYFFLDSSFPMIHSLAQKGETNQAIRFSEFESIDTVLRMAGKATWVWIDCFTKLPINSTQAIQLKQAGFKLCLVSPELQGRPDDILTYAKELKTNNIQLDSICTKIANIPLWESLL